MPTVVTPPRIIGPQRGFQTKVLSSGADITIAGGAAGCGKSFVELMAAAAWTHIPDYSAVFFRRTTPQITNPGALWDQSRRLYPLLGAKPKVGDLTWTWPSGAYVKMSHLEHEKTVENWQGSELPLIIFDELTHFTAAMFWYMLSRNRSTCGVRPYIIASCNPDADSWVAELIAWWIEQDPDSPRYGLPIPERAGVHRYFIRLGDEIIWADTRAELEKRPDVHEAIETSVRNTGLPRERVSQELIKSLTFIPGKLEENRILERANPGYRGNLMSMTRVLRARLLDGNWKIRAAAGDYFKRIEVTMLDAVPTDLVQIIRRWDLAATEPSETNKDPDWTYGVKIGKRSNGRFVVLHALALRKRSDDVRKDILKTARLDGSEVKIGIPQDPGQAGKDQVASYVKLLVGYRLFSDVETGDKETRADPFASQWQGGNVDVIRAPWNEHYFNQMEGFPKKEIHDDAVDASAGAFRQLVRGFNMFDAYRDQGESGSETATGG
jgi:predicted phage terminase large subunit-like protein